MSLWHDSTRDWTWSPGPLANIQLTRPIGWHIYNCMIINVTFVIDISNLSPRDKLTMGYWTLSPFCQYTVTSKLYGDMLNESAFTLSVFDYKSPLPLSLSLSLSLINLIFSLSQFPLIVPLPLAPFLFLLRAQKSLLIYNLVEELRGKT